MGPQFKKNTKIGVEAANGDLLKLRKKSGFTKGYPGKQKAIL